MILASFPSPVFQSQGYQQLQMAMLGLKASLPAEVQEEQTTERRLVFHPCLFFWLLCISSSGPKEGD